MWRDKEPLTLARMQALLRHHGDQNICRHGECCEMNTEYSMIGLPRENRVLCAHGYPCENEYEDIML